MSNQFWPRVTEHTLGTLTRRLQWQCGMIEGPEPFKFANDEKIARSKAFPIKPGLKVRIYWNEDQLDRGYLMTLPGFEGNDCYMAGVVHVPEPNNWGGKDSLPPLWLTLDELARLEIEAAFIDH